MANLTIERSIDIENIIRLALAEKFTIYCRPLPEDFTVPCLLVQQVGGTDSDRIDTFEVVIDARAKIEEEALLLIRNAIGALKAIAKAQTTEIRHISVNSSGSWGNDPVRPDLAMCSARIRVTAHQETTTI